ncbi:polyphosphate:AMP phosphotransferase [uncultured Methanomethylovorans sp.]|uniref:polyphosphate:AMP phosphotransferase n=1 Tax=uncultured Methanomethylovorans sp. TaxID=183759 RepID=UPI002AA60731|nr:polyphosphate:AMP phosphotransferase [uncultured Methanomethylovorans sp.]
MLENIDLSSRMSKEEYKARIDDLYIRIGELQRKAWKMQIPVIIVFEGWHASGMDSIINRCMLAFNPMGLRFHVIVKPSEEESRKPMLWRFWQKIPAYGKIAIFERSWYSRSIIESFDRKSKYDELNYYIKEINKFEKQLTNDGYLLMKFFMHISQQEQAKRLKVYKKKDIPISIVAEELDYDTEYKRYFSLVDEMIEKTHLSHSPWTIVGAENSNHATIKILSTILITIENYIESKLQTNCLLPISNKIDDYKPSSHGLLNADLSLTIEDELYEQEKDFYQKILGKLQYELFREKRPLMIAFEGWDAAGKGGNIKRIAELLDPRLYKVEPIGVPNDYEKSHHYLWRFYRRVPEAGHITIFDRSWYGRVLVERVENFCFEDRWKQAYEEINEFEETLTDFGTIIVKFWLHLDKEEQLRRFQSRENTPEKQWKITKDDWRNREKWDDYLKAVDEMLLKTDTSYAPWTVVESNDKNYFRIKTLKTLVGTIEKNLR